MKIIVIAITTYFLLVASAMASTVATQGYFEIDKIYAWSDYAGEVFKVTLVEPDASSSAACPSGYWLDTANGKNSGTLSVVLSAYHSKVKVKIYGNSAADWPNLDSKECKISLVILE